MLFEGIDRNGLTRSLGAASERESIAWGDVARAVGLALSCAAIVVFIAAMTLAMII
jgi:hypothetical protein